MNKPRKSTKANSMIALHKRYVAGIKAAMRKLAPRSTGADFEGGPNGRNEIVLLAGAANGGSRS